MTTPEEELPQPVECNTCGWFGDLSDLDMDENNEFEVCPDCGSDDLYFF